MELWDCGGDLGLASDVKRCILLDYNKPLPGLGGLTPGQQHLPLSIGCGGGGGGGNTVLHTVILESTSAVFTKELDGLTLELR